MRNGSTADQDGAVRPRAVVLVLAVLLLFGVVVRIVHWHPGLASDDSIYMNNAKCLALGQPPEVMNQHTSRLGYQGFLALGMRMFGSSTTTCQAMGLVVFAGTALLLYILTSMIYGPRPALVCVFFFTTLPIDITNSTAVLPDGLMSMLTIAACVLYFAARSREEGRFQLMLAFAAGLALGLATSVKEPAVAVGIVFTIDLLLHRGLHRRTLLLVALIGAGGLLVLGLETLAFQAWTNDGLYRFHDSVPRYGGGGDRVDIAFQSTANYLIIASDSWGRFGVHGYLLLIGCLLALNHGLKRHSLPLLFVLITAGLLIGALTYLSYPKYAHYIYPVLVMGCVIPGVELYRAVRILQVRPFVVASCCLLLVAISLWAAKETNWRGTVPMAKWLNEIGEEDKQKLVLLDTFVRRQALENRVIMENFSSVKQGDIASGDNLQRLLTGRGLVIDQWDWVRPRGQEKLQDPDRKLLSVPLSFREERVYGVSWPPYKRWLGIGEQKALIGRIWWLQSDAMAEENNSGRSSSRRPSNSGK